MTDTPSTTVARDAIPDDVRKLADDALRNGNIKAHMLGVATDPIEVICAAIMADRKVRDATGEALWDTLAKDTNPDFPIPDAVFRSWVRVAAKRIAEQRSRADKAEAALSAIGVALYAHPPVAPAADRNAVLGPDGKEWAKTEAGYAHVETMLPRADGTGVGPYWYGWALREAFVAGAEWQERRGAPPRGRPTGGDGCRLS